MRRTPTAAAILAIAAAAISTGCGDNASPEVALRWNPGGGEFGAFPDDSFTVDDPATRTGLRLDLTAERIPEVAAFTDTYAEIFSSLSRLDGFGLSAGIWLRFDGALDPSSVVSGEITASPLADQAAPVALIAVTEDGPAPWPYEAFVTDDGATLVLEPMVPLPPRTEIRVAVTDRLRAADGRPVTSSQAMKVALAGGGDPRVGPRVAAAAADLVGDGGVASIDQLAGVVVFTTQSVREDGEAIAAEVAARDIAPLPGTTCEAESRWVRCEGSFDAVDYRGDGDVIPDLVGAIDTGRRYTLAFTAWLPLDRPGPYGGTAFPTVIFGHGLGGTREQGAELAEFAAPRGMATIAIDAVRHGEHPTAESPAALRRILDFFGLDIQELTFQPLRMRDHFRQSTYDKLQLVRMLRGGVDVDGDAVVDLDPDRLSYLGVSLGGIMGPELLALAPEISAAVLVVAGGRVSTVITDAERFSIIVDLMRPEGTTDGDVDRFLPVLQTLLDRGDAVTWAPSVLGAGSGPHLLMGMAIDDDTVPNVANRALARALRIPVVPPLRQEVGIVSITAAAPVAANMPDGQTAGLLQFDRVIEGGQVVPATHGNLAASSVGIEAWFTFLDSHLRDGSPTIIDPYVVLGIDD